MWIGVTWFTCEAKVTLIFLFSFAFLLRSRLLSRSPTMAAAPPNAFRAALQRIGINAPTRTAINENGFETIIDLATVQEDDLDRLPKHLEAWRNPAAGPNNQV